VDHCRSHVLQNYATLISADEMARAQTLKLVYVLGIGMCGDETGEHLFTREDFIGRKPQLVAFLSNTGQGGPILNEEDTSANVAYILVIPRSKDSWPTFLIKCERLLVEYLDGRG
jgi:hypothetical protein